MPANRHTVPCSPALRPTTLDNVGAIQLIPEPTNSNTGLAVVFSLLIIGLAIGVGWIIYKHRSNTGSAFRALCCGGSSNYQATP